MTPADLATALDYADALHVARKAKGYLAALILFMLAFELALFFTVRYAQSTPAGFDHLHYLVGLIGFLGLLSALLLAFNLLLIVNIMLAGRLLGLTRMMWALIWCVALLLLMFPWQAFLADAAFAHPDFKIPGVLYTWDELHAGAHFAYSTDPWNLILLRWARFVGFPFAAMIITVLIQIQSTRGIRLAQGDAPDSARSV